MSVANISKALEELKRRSIDAFISSLAVPPSESNLSKVVAFLRERGVYEVFLPEGNRCGMISVREVLKLGGMESTKLATVTLHVPVISEHTTVEQAARLMYDHRISAVPVSDGRGMIGQVNRLDLLKEIRGRIGNEMRITSIASASPVTIETSTSVASARDLMLRKRIDHIPVIHERRLTGLITSSQIVSRITVAERIGSKSRIPEIKRSFDFPVRDVMELNPLTCAPETVVDAALDLMLDNSKTYVLITQWYELQAVATHRDFVMLLAEAEPKPDVPISIIGLPEDPFEAEAAKAKFSRTVNQLHRIFPDILEAKSVIKSKFSRPGKERGRYEVTVHIRTARKSYAYSESGWELPAVYDHITDRLKRLMTQKRRRITREREQLEIT